MDTVFLLLCIIDLLRREAWLVGRVRKSNQEKIETPRNVREIQRKRRKKVMLIPKLVQEGIIVVVSRENKNVRSS
jgi:hypothetical protein